jgi:hypothetical protein
LRVADGENVGLTFATERLVVFDPLSERALQSDLYAGGARG